MNTLPQTLAHTRSQPINHVNSVSIVPPSTFIWMCFGEGSASIKARTMSAWPLLDAFMSDVCPPSVVMPMCFKEGSCSVWCSVW